MRRSRRVLASALLGLLVGLLTTILLVVPAGAAFVLGGKAPSEQLTYSYDSPSTTTTPPATSRTDAARGRPGARTSPDAVRLVSGSFLVARGADEVPELGKKLDFAFGRASGSTHNVERSVAMQRQLGRIGIQDTPAGRTQLAEHFTGVLRDPSNIARAQANGRLVRESLLMGPRGGVKVESIWEGPKLITFKFFGAR